MSLDELPTRNKLYFIDLVKSGEKLVYPESRTNHEIEQMARAGYFDRLDTERIGCIVFKPTQKLRDVCAIWDETELRSQDNTESFTEIAGGIYFGY